MRLLYNTKRINIQGENEIITRQNIKKKKKTLKII